MEKKKFEVTGMTCAACQANVEKAVNRLEGVDSVAVNLLTGGMTVLYDREKTNDDAIVAAVKDVGYGASVAGERATSSDIEDDEEERYLKLRLKVSLVFLVLLMYVSMGHMVGLFVPRFFQGREGAVNYAFTQFLLALPVIYINRKFYIVGFKGLARRAPNMDSLVALGSSSALIYGIFAIYRMSHGMGVGDMELVDHYRHNLYFESAAMILALITVGKYLEEKSKNKTTTALKELMDLAPKKATVLRGGKEVEVPVEELSVGDAVLVRPGESVAVDGVILRGSSSLDESAVTGESIPVSKTAGDPVISASINGSGSFVFEAKKVGQDTTIAKIISLVDEANQSKAPIAKLADKIASVFVPLVIAIALVTFTVWMAVGQTFEFALNMAISVLVISCPCALGLATPVAIMVATGRSAQLGLLFKNAEVLENLHKVDTVVLDKTGTITNGVPFVTDLITDMDEGKFLQLAASMEVRSEHPLSRSILDYGEKMGVSLLPVEDFLSVGGRGITAVIQGKTYAAGNFSFMEERSVDVGNYRERGDSLARDGKTSMYFADENRVLGLIAVKDLPKKSSRRAIDLLKERGYETVMLTGDHEITAEAVRRELGIDRKVAGLLPQEKNLEIEKLQNRGKSVLMIGDGINDAPSLAKADIGMAIGHGTDVAIESSDVVLMRGDLLDVVNAIDLSKATIKNIKENLFWAFFYNTLGIPLAAGVFYPIFGWKLNPMFGSFAMSLSSLFVVTNALRLRRFQPKILETSSEGEVSLEEKSKREGEKKVPRQEIFVEGMMCEHCEKRVKSSLENTGKVRNVKGDYRTGSVTFENISADEKDILTAVFKAGYEVKGVNIMEKKVKVEGMSCSHCAGAVKRALEELENVMEARVDLEKKEAVLLIKDELYDNEIQKAVEDAGYVFGGVVE